MECGLALSVLLSTTIRVIIVVKICCGLTQLPLVSKNRCQIISIIIKSNEKSIKLAGWSVNCCVPCKTWVQSRHL